jgi:uncharacterized membrane protein YjjP (DUF1212 family)
MSITPALLLLILIAVASGSLAHVLWGRRWLQIPIFMVAAFVGGLIVYALNLRLPFELPTPGGVPLLEAVFAGWLLLFIAVRIRL